MLLQVIVNLLGHNVAFATPQTVNPAPQQTHNYSNRTGGPLLAPHVVIEERGRRSGTPIVARDIKSQLPANASAIKIALELAPAFTCNARVDFKKILAYHENLMRARLDRFKPHDVRTSLIANGLRFKIDEQRGTMLLASQKAEDKRQWLCKQAAQIQGMKDNTILSPRSKSIEEVREFAEASLAEERKLIADQLIVPILDGSLEDEKVAIIIEKIAQQLPQELSIERLHLDDRNYSAYNISDPKVRATVIQTIEDALNEIVELAAVEVSVDAETAETPALDSSSNSTFLQFARREEANSRKPKVYLSHLTPEKQAAKDVGKIESAYDAGRRIARGCKKVNMWKQPFVSKPYPAPVCAEYSRLGLKWSKDHGCTEQDLKQALQSKSKQDTRTFGFTKKDYYTFIGYVFQILNILSTRAWSCRRNSP